MAKGIWGGALLSGSVVLKVLNAFQLLDGLITTLRTHGAGAVADALLSNVFVAACAIAGLALLYTRRREPPPKERRIFVHQTPDEVMALYQGRTSHQGDKLFADLKGKWITVIGKVNNISSHGRSGFCVSAGEMGTHIMLFFEKAKANAISHLNVGDQITVRGQLSNADRSTLTVRKCELESVGNQKPTP